jgi:phenylpropionate dioxygenase-like ring-hydroxylating dioxygenase large terminal subunit
VDEHLPTDVEIERALRRAWFPVARAGDLHQPRRVDLLGETLVAYLTDRKAPRVAADRCAHRGASLADGRVEGDGPRAATENFRDVAHSPFGHRSTMGHIPEVVEPLAVERRGAEVFLTRVYNASGGDEGLWQEQMTFSYHAVAPCFVCLRIEHESGGVRFLLNAPSPHTAPTEPGRPRTTIFWVEGFTPDYTEMTLEEVLETEALVYEEDNPILERIEPGEAPLDPAAQVHTPADRYTLEYRRAFIEFVREANTQPGTSAMGTAAFEPATSGV